MSGGDLVQRARAQIATFERVSGTMSVELCDRIAALEAEVEELTKLGERFDAPGGNLFTYVAELEAKLAALEPKP